MKKMHEVTEIFPPDKMQIIILIIFHVYMLSGDVNQNNQRHGCIQMKLAVKILISRIWSGSLAMW